MTRKIILPIFFSICCHAACTDNADKGNADGTSGQRVPSKNSETFNRSLEKLLASYYELKDALVEYDIAGANAAAGKLAIYADSLPVRELGHGAATPGKESAGNQAGIISSSAIGLKADPAIQGKKKEFESISTALYNLVSTVKYDRQTIYRQRCPMAFNDDTEAFWLSNSSEIVNPYLGKKHPKYKSGMLACGEVTDTLDFGGKR